MADLMILSGEEGGRTALRVSSMKLSTPNVFFSRIPPERRWYRPKVYVLEVNGGQAKRLTEALARKLFWDTYGDTPMFKRIVMEDLNG